MLFYVSHEYAIHLCFIIVFFAKRKQQQTKQIVFWSKAKRIFNVWDLAELMTAQNIEENIHYITL